MREGQTPKYPASVDIAILGDNLYAATLAAEASARGLSCALMAQGDIVAGSSALPLSVFSENLRELEQLNLGALYSNIQQSYDNLRSYEERQTKTGDKHPPPSFWASELHLIDNPAVRHRKIIATGIRFYQRLLKRKKFTSLQNFPSPSSINWEKQTLSSAKQITYTAIPYNDFFCSPRLNTLDKIQQAKHHQCQLYNYTQLTQIARHKSYWHLTILTDSGMTSPYSATLKADTLVRCSAHLYDQKKYARHLTCRIHSSLKGYIYFDLESDLIEHLPLTLQNNDKSLLYITNLNKQVGCIGPIHLNTRTSNAFNQSTPDIKSEHLEAEKTALEKSTLQQIENTTGWTIPKKNRLKSQWVTDYMTDDPTCNQHSRTVDGMVDWDNPGGKAVAINIHGAGINKCKTVADQCLDILAPFLPHQTSPSSPHPIASPSIPSPTANSFPLEKWPLNPRLIERLRTHSTPGLTALFSDYLSRQETTESKNTHNCGLGLHFGHGLYEIEVKFYLEDWFAKTAEDILWRRTALGIYFSEEETHHLNEWIAHYFATPLSQRATSIRG